MITQHYCVAAAGGAARIVAVTSSLRMFTVN
jgi:hypothetical protein